MKRSLNDVPDSPILQGNLGHQVVLQVDAPQYQQFVARANSSYSLLGRVSGPSRVVYLKLTICYEHRAGNKSLKTNECCQHAEKQEDRSN